MKKFIAVLVIVGLLSLLVAACSASGAGSGYGSGSGSSSGSSSGGASSSATVHLGNTNFDQSSVTISKGGSITLIDDGGATHIISNGSWVNGTPKPAAESGAPVVKNLTFSAAGQSKTIGPFNTAGTYHLYCSVHPNMNLTVIVQ